MRILPTSTTLISTFEISQNPNGYRFLTVGFFPALSELLRIAPTTSTTSTTFFDLLHSPPLCPPLSFPFSINLKKKSLPVHVLNIYNNFLGTKTYMTASQALSNPTPKLGGMKVVAGSSVKVSRHLETIISTARTRPPLILPSSCLSLFVSPPRRPTRFYRSVRVITRSM